MDWKRFFASHNIPYRDRGRNISAGNIVIKCPWCGASDHGEHLSVALDSKMGYYCYRDNRHRGKSPVGLIVALLGVSVEQARSIADGGIDIPADFKARVKSLLGPLVHVERPGLKLPDDFREFKMPLRVSSVRFWNYLLSRGFDKEKRLLNLLRHFNIRYAVNGPFAERIIFPITLDGIIVNWTGRAISKNSDLRYRTLSTDEEKSRTSELPQAVGPITDYLLWYDECYESDAETLVLVEGPFDAFKVWYLGYREGIVSACFFTNDASDSQMELVELLALRFKRVVLLLDQGAYHKALGLKRQRTHNPKAFPGLRIDLVMIPEGIKDPGELSSLRFLLRN